MHASKVTQSCEPFLRMGYSQLVELVSLLVTIKQCLSGDWPVAEVQSKDLPWTAVTQNPLPCLNMSNAMPVAELQSKDLPSTKAFAVLELHSLPPVLTLPNHI